MNITIDRKVIEQALDALESIALAGMSGSGQESEEGMREWHARKAWKFIGIAARALSPLRGALNQPQQEPYGYLYEGTAEHTRSKTLFRKTPEPRLETRWWREVGPIYTSPQQPPPPPPECKTEAERTAYAFGWFKALETVRQKKEVK